MDNINCLKMNAGELHLIIGCMYSGKSTELMKIIKYYQILDKKIFVINHKIDNRYGDDAIISHDKKSFPCHKTNKLMIMKNFKKCIESDVIIIEEAQFFEDLKPFVEEFILKNKIVYVAGLDGDSFMKPFGHILELIPMCDSVKKLSALCIKCKNGTKANFSKRIVNNSEQRLIGSFESFIPVCRYHYNN